jgi:hypothetical protein
MHGSEVEIAGEQSHVGLIQIRIDFAVSLRHTGEGSFWEFKH